VQDFEMSPLSQPDAAVQADPDYTDTEDTVDDEPLPPPPARSGRAREGLPAAYRMRHAPHYVEQLIRDPPNQTDRQIATDQIDQMDQIDETGPRNAGAVTEDLTEQAASIGRVGLLQPLLVVQADEGRFNLIAGSKRLVAARAAGLGSVPCLVVHAEQGRAAELREQAAVRSLVNEPEPVAPPEAAPEPEAAAPGPLDRNLAAAFEEVSGALAFVSALMPVASVARSPFQQAVIADVIQVENRRAAALSAAASFLLDSEPLRPEEFDWLEFTEGLRADIAVEARLRGVEVEWLQSLKLRAALADRKAVLTAWTAILHATLGIAAAGDRVAISLATPRVRPAIIFTVTLRTGPRFIPVEGEQDGTGAFAGGVGELMVVSARQSAQRQGGRLSVATTADSLTMEFVAPQPLAYWQ
jgi:hypothetical protein